VTRYDKLDNYSSTRNENCVAICISLTVVESCTPPRVTACCRTRNPFISLIANNQEAITPGGAIKMLSELNLSAVYRNFCWSLLMSFVQRRLRLLFNS